MRPRASAGDQKQEIGGAERSRRPEAENRKLGEERMNPIGGIYSLCDTGLTPGKKHLELAEQLLEGGVRILQLRMKGETDLKRVRQTARSLLLLKKKFPFTFILNDFVEIGLELGVDGIHVGRDDLDLETARRLAGSKFLLGYSSHSLEEALEAERRGADYLALGAIYPTATKGPGHPVVGISTLQEVVKRIRIPVVAIGGINRKNLQQVATTGVAAVAMISALNTAPDVTAEARWFVEEWGRIRPET